MTSRRVRSWSDDDASRGSDSPAPQTFTWEDRAVALLCAAARRGDAFSGPTGLGRRILGFDEPCAACLAHVPCAWFGRPALSYSWQRVDRR